MKAPVLPTKELPVRRSTSTPYLAGVLLLVTGLAPWMSAQTPPPNDMLANSIALSGATVTVIGSNVGATQEPGEPSPLVSTVPTNPGGRSVWWNWTAPANGTVAIDTIGSSFDTLLAVFTGAKVTGLTPVASSDDGGGLTNGASRVLFSAAAGTVYQIAVDGYRYSFDTNNLCAASGAIVLNVRQGPFVPWVYTPATNQMTLLNRSCSWSAQAVGMAPLSYQWLFNGQPIGFATNSSYMLPAAYNGCSGPYSVVVSNSDGVSTTLLATLAMLSAIITSQPQNASAAVGYNASFAVTASSTAALSYQWQKNGTNIAGATSSVLSLTNVQSQDAAVYRALVNVSSFQLASSNAVLSVVQPYTFATLAGWAGSAGSVDGAGSAARFDAPSGVALDAAGNLYVTDRNANTVRKVTPGGRVSTLAGMPYVTGTNDGPGVSAQFNQPEGLAVDLQGNVYVADNLNNTIRKIRPDGLVSTLAGIPGLMGREDGPASSALFGRPAGLAVDAGGNVFTAEWFNGDIRKITPDGMVTTLAGPISKTYLPSLAGLALDGAGNFYVSSQPGAGYRWYKVSAAGFVLAWGFAPNAYGGAVDGQGSFYMGGFFGENCVRRVAPDGELTILAGVEGVAGYSDGAGTQAAFNAGRNGIAVDKWGNLYVADSGNNVIRIGAPFVVTAIPQSVAVPAGTNVTLCAASSDASLDWQWLFAGAPLANQTNACLALGPANRANSGAYSLVVSNSTGNWLVFNVTVRALVPSVLQVPRVQRQGSVSLLFQDADGGLPYDLSKVTVQWRTNLPSGSDTNWFVLNSNLYLTNGFAATEDTNAVAAASRFYRVVEQ